MIMVCVFETSSCRGSNGNSDAGDQKPGKTIFVYGDGLEKVFIKYVAGLTNKKNPRICFIPTAAADNERVIGYWYKICEGLPVTPTVLMTFISSDPGQKTHEVEIFGSDAIIVGGGNTLNMLAVWKVQGIDSLLRKAYEKGIVLAGGSVGSLCWFNAGSTDSRPQEQTLIE